MFILIIINHLPLIFLGIIHFQRIMCNYLIFDVNFQYCFHYFFLTQTAKT